jgi:hypothetical protein
VETGRRSCQQQLLRLLLQCHELLLLHQRQLLDIQRRSSNCRHPVCHAVLLLLPISPLLVHLLLLLLLPQLLPLLPPPSLLLLRN